MKKAHFLLKMILVSVIVTSGVFFVISSGHCKDRHIRFATVEWEPYWGSKMLNYGYMAEITKEALSRVGYTMEIHFVPWKRALHDVETGYYNALFGSYYNADRVEWLAYTDPVDAGQLVFFAKKENKITWNNLYDLKDYVIGTMQGYHYTDEFNNAGYLKRESVRKLELNIKKLLDDRIDLVCASRKVFLYAVNTNYPKALDQIWIVPKPLATHEIYHGFSKKDPNYFHYTLEFNKGLQIIKADGTFDAILKKHGFN